MALPRNSRRIACIPTQGSSLLRPRWRDGLVEEVPEGIARQFRAAVTGRAAAVNGPKECPHHRSGMPTGHHTLIVRQTIVREDAAPWRPLRYRTGCAEDWRAGRGMNGIPPIVRPVLRDRTLVTIPRLRRSAIKRFEAAKLGDSREKNGPNPLSFLFNHDDLAVLGLISKR